MRKKFRFASQLKRQCNATVYAVRPDKREEVDSAPWEKQSISEYSQLDKVFRHSPAHYPPIIEHVVNG